MLRLLLVASVILKIVMFRDAVRRGVASHWYWIIGFMPAGELVYFAVFKLDEVGWLRPRRKRVGWGAERTAPLAPGVDRSLDHAQTLYEAGRYAQAEGALEVLLQDEPSHPEALYLLAMARMQLDHPAEAVAPLERLVAVKAGLRDYAGWKLLARAREEAGQMSKAIDELERLVERSPRLEHHVLLAELLVRAKRLEEAEAVLFRARNRKGDAEWAKRRDALRERLG
ncbi:MAG: tetratricopeptide repeat protein [Polyangiaceae bacterium]